MYACGARFELLPFHRLLHLGSWCGIGGVTPNTIHCAPAKDGPVEGATPKAAPPLAPAMSKATATTVSAGIGITAASKFASQLPTAPPPDLGQSTRGRLVVDPNQMKKFLYGTSTSSPASSSSRPAANTVSWPISFFRFGSCICSVLLDPFALIFFALTSLNFYLHPLAPICIRFHRWQSLRHPIGNLPQVHQEVDGFEKLVDS